MRKKELLKIVLKGPSEEMTRKAKEDKYISRLVPRQRWTYKSGKGQYEDYYEKVKTYATILHGPERGRDPCDSRIRQGAGGSGRGADLHDIH